MKQETIYHNTAIFGNQYFILKFIHTFIFNLQKTLIREIINQSTAKSPSGHRYSPEWMLNCMLLYIKSPVAYRLLREQKILPLPDKSTISRNLRNSNVGVGFDTNFFKLFEKKMDEYCGTKDRNHPARVGMVMWDEMQTEESVNVNVEAGTLDGLVNVAEYKADNTANNKYIKHLC